MRPVLAKLRSPVLKEIEQFPFLMGRRKQKIRDKGTNERNSMVEKKTVTMVEGNLAQGYSKIGKRRKDD